MANSGAYGKYVGDSDIGGNKVIRGISLVYGLYLLLPIALLLVGSVGGNWTNTLLPSGVTGQWYLDLWQDSSFRKAFASSLVVALSACAINTVLALPLAYALYHGARRGGEGVRVLRETRRRRRVGGGEGRTDHRTRR